jgi:acetyl esterase/lipase
MRWLIYLKKILLGLLILIFLVFACLLTPVVISKLYPQRLPVGYYFIPPTILAVYLGIESQPEKNPPVPEGVEALMDVEYKNIGGKSLKMDIYRGSHTGGPAPLLLFIHGGGWNHGSRNEYLGYALHFARMGYVTATVTYRFASDAPYPACVEDVTDAVRFIFQNGGKYHYDPDRVAVIGGSAGAHLAMLVGYGWHKQDNLQDLATYTPLGKRIKAVVDLYGPTDLTASYARENYMVERLFAHKYKETPGLYAEASPISFVSKNSPPTLILHGTSDSLVPIGQAELLKRKLDSLGIPNVYRPLPGWPHTMDLVKRVNDYCEVAMQDFFDEYVK